MELRIGNRLVGDGHPVFIIAEIGINHNGDLEMARRLIEVAAGAGCDAVKFQKRTPHLCVPPEQMGQMRDTPWGHINYLQYRYKVEFEGPQYDEIDQYCRELGILWFASCWDLPATEFIARYTPPCFKIASATFADPDLLRATTATGKPILASCGMSTEADIEAYFAIVPKTQQVLLHTNSSYPAPIEELNLRTIPSLREKYGCLVGYSGHEAGLFTTPLTVALGACVIERHITLDRNLWGSDHSASVEPKGLYKLVEEIRSAEKAMGDGIKKIYPGEAVARKRLRRTLPRRVPGKTAAIVQARIGSVRLPGKVLENLAGKPLIVRILDRLKRCRTLDQIILAIPDTPQNDPLSQIAEAEQVVCFRGSENDLLARYLAAAEFFQVRHVVRIPADNPCISPKEIDKIVEYHMVTAFDFCSNLYEIQGNGYPDGIGGEVFTAERLRDVAGLTRSPEHREHVHRYFFDHLNVGTILCPLDYAYPSLKLDVNTADELAYLRRIYESLAPEAPDGFFDIGEIVDWHRRAMPEALTKPSLKEYRTEQYAL